MLEAIADKRSPPLALETTIGWLWGAAVANRGKRATALHQDGAIFAIQTTDDETLEALHNHCTVGPRDRSDFHGRGRSYPA